VAGPERDPARRLGLLRKYKGRLLLTKAGAAVGEDPDALFTHIASRLVAGAKPGFVEDADLLVLPHIAVDPDHDPLAPVASLLTDIGYRLDDEPVDAASLHQYVRVSFLPQFWQQLLQYSRYLGILARP